MAKFTNWVKWANRNTLNNINEVGVYAIAISRKNLEGTEFGFIKEIAYFGMTNSVSGLRGRLHAFNHTIQGKERHGGAQRFRHKYPDYEKLTRSLYVSISPFKCDVRRGDPVDLRQMGKVAKFEYDCFAEYMQIHGRLPKFNDKAASPKK